MNFSLIDSVDFISVSANSAKCIRCGIQKWKQTEVCLNFMNFKNEAKRITKPSQLRQLSCLITLNSAFSLNSVCCWSLNSFDFALIKLKSMNQTSNWIKLGGLSSVISWNPASIIQLILIQQIDEVWFISGNESN